jgi:hypothetical protein
MRETVAPLKQFQLRTKFEHFLLTNEEITAAAAQSFEKDPDGVKLFTNGFSDFKLFLRSGVENCPTFNITISYWRGGKDKEAKVGSDDTLVIPEITAGSSFTIVDMELDETKAENSEYIKLSFTLPDPNVSKYIVNMVMVKFAGSLGSGSGGAVSTTGTASAGLRSNYVTTIDGAAAYTSGTTITLSGFPFTVDDSNSIITAIQYKSSGSNEWTTLTNGVDGVSMSASGNVVTVSGLSSDPFAAGDEYIVTLIGKDKAYDSLSDCFLIRNTRDLTTYHNFAKYSATTSSDAIYIDMERFGECSLDIDIGAGSLDIDVSNNYDTAVGSISHWETIVGGSGISADTMIKMESCYKWLRINPSSATFTIYFSKKQRV